MKIVFMGTPHFAVPALKALMDSRHELVAVYTKHPSVSGRHLQETKSPIHILAEEGGLNVFTPKTLKAEEISKLESMKPDIGVVVAYGLILREEVLQIPKFGFINIHPSDLPRWRGAAPIQRTIMSGDTKTALCIMQMDAGIDTGDIILRQEVLLDEKITSAELHNDMSSLGATMLLESLKLFEDNNVRHIKQSEIGVTYADKINRKHERIDWNDDVRAIHCKIRGFSPKPAAYFIYNDEIIKIITADYEYCAHNHQFGKVIDDKLTIACKGGILKPTLLQRQGRKMIYTDAFLRGYQINEGVVL